MLPSSPEQLTIIYPTLRDGHEQLKAVSICYAIVTKINSCPLLCDSHEQMKTITL